MNEYKESTEDNSEKSSILESPKEADLQSEEAFHNSLETLKNMENFEDSTCLEFFENLKYMILHKDFYIDPSIYVDSGFLSILLQILLDGVFGIHSNVLSIICELSKYDEVLEFLNKPQYLDYFFGFAINHDNPLVDVREMILILQRIIPLVTEESDILSFPIVQFCDLKYPNDIIPYFMQLIVSHPGTEAFKSIIDFINTNCTLDDEAVSQITNILKNVLIQFPTQIIYVVGEEDEENFLLNLINATSRDEYDSLYNILSMFHVLLTDNFYEVEGLFSAIIDSDILQTAFEIFLEDKCDDEYKYVAASFIEHCLLNDQLRESVIESIDKNTYNILINGVHDCPHQMIRSCIVIISFYIQYYQFPAAQAAVESGILELLDNYIEVSIPTSISCLNTILKSYLRQGHAKEIIEIIDNTDIIQDLNDVTSENENYEELKEKFLEDYEKLCNILEQS